jgi:hypothetical protein
MARQPILTAAVGKKGVGKTYTTLNILRQYVRGSASFSPRRVLVLDVNDEFVDVPALALKDVALFCQHPKIEMRRVRAFKDNGKNMSLNEIADSLSLILENFRTGALLIEDINKFVADSYSTDIIGGIVTQRHRGCDMILHFQTIGRAGHPKILGNLNILRMHKTFDTIDKHENKFEDKYEMIKIAELIINMKFRGYEIGGVTHKPDIRYYLYCNFDTDKIMGSFSRLEVERCIKEYIWENENTTIKPMLRMRNDEGRFMYNQQNVLQAKVQELLKLYFSF